MHIDQISSERLASFKAANGMSLQDALIQIRKWIDEKNYIIAESGLREVERYAEGLDDINSLKEAMRVARWWESVKVQSVQDVVMKTVDKSVQTSSQAPMQTSVSDSALLPEERLISAFCYVFFLWVIWICFFLVKRSVFCLHHGIQGLVIFAMLFACQSITVFLPFADLLYKTFNLAFLVIIFYGWYKGYKWIYWEAPVVWGLVAKISKSFK